MCIRDRAALALLAANWRFPAPVRALTVTALNLSHSAPEQLTLFDEGASSRSDKHERLEKSLDAIRGKYGHAAIAGASVLNRGLGLGKLSIDEDVYKRQVLLLQGRVRRDVLSRTKRRKAAAANAGRGGFRLAERRGQKRLTSGYLS